MKVTLLWITPNPEKICESSARICYNSKDKQTETSHETMLPNLLKSGHASIFEHSSASFLIEGISRACSHQLVRHRLSSFSQRSQRYVNEHNFDYILPSRIKTNLEAAETYRETMEIINKQYQKLINLGIKKEDARFVLPNATSTQLVMTANFRQWLHIIKLRTALGSQWEIKELMTIINQTLHIHAPNTFKL